MSDPIADLLAAQAKGASTSDPIGAILHAQASAAPAQAAMDPSEGRLPFAPFGIDTGLTMPQGVSRFMAGAGKAFVDIGRGAGQLVGAVDRKDIDEATRLDAPLMKTGAGTAGNVVGNMAALAPTVMIPGATTIGGGALVGAGSSLLQPVGTDGSRFQNMAIGAAGGAAIPAAIRTAKVLKAGLVDPFTQAGRQRIVGNVLAKSAANPQQAVQNMNTVQAATPGFQPTAAQASGDAGIAAMERTARAIDPAGFGDVDQAQRGALVNALRDIAKTPEDRAAAVAAVDANARDLYGKAFQENVDVTPTLTRLASRPSMQAAEARAIALAKELGMPFNARLADMQPKTVYAGTRNLADSSVTDVAQQYNPLTMTTHNIEADRLIPSGTVPNYVDIPPVDSVPVRDMHTLKMGMDALLSDPTQGIAGREAAALKATRNKLLDQLPDSYQVARQAHIEMNKPVNQMDIGQELYNRFVPALADGAGTPFKTRADAYAQALRNGDKLAQNVTGLKNATMDGIMTPEQMGSLHGVASDAAMIGAAQGAGRGAGSDTVQKMAMSNLIDQSGLPTWVSALAPLRSVGGMVRTAGDILYTKNDETMRHLLADVLKSPAQAAAAMQKSVGATPAAYARLLQMAGQNAAIGVSATANASK